jgi:hypothetical protein
MAYLLISTSPGCSGGTKSYSCQGETNKYWYMLDAQNRKTEGLTGFSHNERLEGKL